MESSGYERSMQLVIGGLAALTLLVLWLLNVFFDVSSEVKWKNEQIAMAGSMMTAAKSMDDSLQLIYDRLELEGAWLTEQWTASESEGNALRLTDGMYFLPEQNISQSSETVAAAQDTGNVIFNGDIRKATPQQKTLINAMPDFFKYCALLQKSVGFDMTTTFFHKENLIAYYPHQPINGADQDFDAVFDQVNTLLEQVALAETDGSSANLSWHYVGVNLAAYAPVYREGEFQGILSVGLPVEQLAAYTSNSISRSDVDVYLVDEQNLILYTNTVSDYVLKDANSIFNIKYGGLSYYRNKFPVNFEIRENRGYTQYISSMSQPGWFLVAVERTQSGTSPLQLFVSAVYIVVGLLLLLAILRSYYKRRQRLREVFHTASTDSMTGLLNHNNIIDRLERMMRQRRIRMLGVMMVDIDNFKGINDTYGHAYGDEVIKLCARILADFANRGEEAAGRYGGEEFMVIMGNSSEEAVVEAAERIRISFNERMVRELDLEATVSIGLFLVKKPTRKEASHLIEMADQNLYKAKHSGKNRVVFSDQ